MRGSDARWHHEKMMQSPFSLGRQENQNRIPNPQQPSWIGTLPLCIHSSLCKTKQKQNLHVAVTILTLLRQLPSLVVAWRNRRKVHLVNNLARNLVDTRRTLVRWLLERER